MRRASGWDCNLEGQHLQASTRVRERILSPTPQYFPARSSPSPRPSKAMPSNARHSASHLRCGRSSHRPLSPVEGNRGWQSAKRKTRRLPLSVRKPPLLHRRKIPENPRGPRQPNVRRGCPLNFAGRGARCRVRSPGPWKRGPAIRLRRCVCTMGREHARGHVGSVLQRSRLALICIFAAGQSIRARPMR